MRRQRRGMVLIIVLVVVAILALSAYTYALMMQSEAQATKLQTSRLQSKFLVESGADAIRIYLSQTDEALIASGGTYDNPAIFQNVQVWTDENGGPGGFYSVIAPSLDDQGIPGGFRSGLVDESTRLNLNILLLADELLENGGRNLLMALPNMTEDIADAIMDWIDEDDEPREYGAEFDYYTGLSPSYTPKNGPLESTTELLLVRGVTPELLFGGDVNQNGVIDDQENEISELAADEEMALGWISYITLYSKEKNLTQEGLQKISINSMDLEQLERDLRSIFDEEWTRFILYMRLYGPTEANDEDALDMTETTAFATTIDYAAQPSFQFTQVLDLVDAMVTVPDVGPPEEGEEEPTDAIIRSPIRSENLIAQLPLLMGNLTTSDSRAIPGRININQAPRRILEGIPGMLPEIIDVIVANREFEPSGDNENRLYETWILAEGLVDLETMRLMLPFVCSGGAVYRAEITGYFDEGKMTSRSEVVIDSTEIFPRILFWREKSHLQVGYELDTLGIGDQLDIPTE